MQVRTNGTDGFRLFDYDPCDNAVTIVKHKKIYRVKLYDHYHGGGYKIVNMRPRDLIS